MSRLAIPRGTARPQRASHSRRGASVDLWNAPSAWRWIAGDWDARVDLPVFQKLARAASASTFPNLAVRSRDRWSVGPEGVRVCGTGSRALMNVAVAFGVDGRPTLTLSGGEDGQTSELHATGATKRAITFQGATVPARPGRAATSLEVTIQRVGKLGLCITGLLKDDRLCTSMFAYEAARHPGGLPPA